MKTVVYLHYPDQETVYSSQDCMFHTGLGRENGRKIVKIVLSSNIAQAGRIKFGVSNFLFSPFSSIFNAAGP